MPFRASFKCCAMTTISSSAAGDPEPPEFASESAASPANAAWAGERGPNKHRKDAATPEAAARIEKLNMRTAPQKLIDDEPRPIARAVHFARRSFSLRKAGRGCAAGELRCRSRRCAAPHWARRRRGRGEGGETR